MVGLINKEDIYDIADAIREKTQTEDTFKPSEMGDLIRSIRVLPENSYQLKEIESTPTSLATFDADALPMPSLKVGIEPIQEGSGDPSPTNVRPISGWDEVNVTVSPLNISQLYNGQIYGDGTWVENSARLTNVQTAQSNTYFLKAGTYTLDFDKLNSNASNLVECAVLTKDSNFNIIDNFANAWQPLPFTFTLTQDGYLYFTVRKDYGTVLSPSDYRGKILGTTYTIDLDGTRYGGTLDVVSGELKVVPYYASYNGETLEGEWISDRDVYAVGTTPTIGAQVVNIGATPTTIQLTPTQVKSLLGTNNIWADTGNILEGEYFKAL